MGFHTFDPERVARLEDPTRFRFCSREELLEPLPNGSGTAVVDLGSGSGFYTDEIAPFVDTVYAVDVQPEMHDHYRDRGVPDNVVLTTAAADALPFDDGQLDGAVSTMTFHESTTEAAMAELARVLAAGATAVVVDWTSDGRGESGPPVSERYDRPAAVSFFQDAGFSVELAADRSETFRIVARR
jgi:ubiquinone/menaquinone biosynthesis C-methylase UbiE